MGVILMCMSWESARVRAVCPLWLWLYSAKKTTQEPIDMPIIVALEGVLACTSLGEEHRGPWGLLGQAGKRWTDRQRGSERLTAEGMGMIAHCSYLTTQNTNTDITIPKSTHAIENMPVVCL